MSYPQKMDWQAPIPLGATELPEWPENIFTDEIQKFVSGLAESTETPPALATMAVLSGISAACRGKFLIQVKEGYTESINIWTAVALPSGSRKSAIQNVVTKQFTEWEKQEKLVKEPEIKAIVLENKSLEARLKELRRMGACAKPEEYERFQSEIVSLEGKIREVPVIPQLWTSDITPEGLAVLMQENNGSMAILSDEAGVFDVLAGRYSSGIPNLDLFLQAHNRSPVRVNRSGRPPIFLDHPVLTMGLTPQPDLLRGLTKVPAFRGRGLLARFLYVLPESNLGQRTLSTLPLSKELEASYHRMISSILAYSNSIDGVQILRLSPDAFLDWHAYALSVEINMGEGGQLAHLTDWAGKLPGAIARVAALLHIARYLDTVEALNEVDDKDMRAAIRLGFCLSQHALAVFDLMGADNVLDGARIILKWILRNRFSRFTFRDCHHDNKSKFPKAKDLEPSIEILEERHYIREREKEKTPHRPSRIFDVNPNLHKEDM
jgi:hypothetical protein